MPWLLCFAILLILVVVGAVVVTVADSSATHDATIVAAPVAVVAAILAIVMLIWSCVTIVSTRNVGIVTSFGRPVGVLDNGLHLKLPWKKVSELDGTIQTDSQIGTFNGEGRCDNGTPVRLAINTTACVDNTIRWRIAPNAGDSLFRDYVTNANIQESLVTRELNATLNEVFSTYNPLAADAGAGPNLTDLSNLTTQKLQGKIGSQIEVQNVIISILHFDDNTQGRINALQAQNADTRIAEAKQQTATAEAQANRLLSASVSNDPNVLVSKCLDLIAQGKTFPAGFSCWPNGGMPVTIPAR